MKTPRFTVKTMMILVSCIAIACCTARTHQTVYAPGFDEIQFQKLRNGMIREEVVAMIGQPLRIESTSQRWAGLENWMYSDPPSFGILFGPRGGDYERRWVFFDPQNGNKVSGVIGDYWID